MIKLKNYEKECGNHRIQGEELYRKERFLDYQIPEKSFFEDALNTAVAKVRRNLKDYEENFPEVNSRGLKYVPMANTEWATGFWTGMVWLAYEATGDEAFRHTGERHVEDFIRRFDEKEFIDTHDLGFLYSLSCKSGWQLTGSDRAREITLRAAEHLLGRYNDPSGMIRSNQTKGKGGSSRIIIDCMLNLPLLYWAHKETGNQDYYAAAYNNALKTVVNLVRQDGSSYQVCYVNPGSGELVDQATHQGYSKDSTWGRGQAWGIYGFPLTYIHTGEERFLDVAKAMVHYFLNRQPFDDVSGWDLTFTDKDARRDTSASAVAVCGMLELAKHLPVTDRHRIVYEKAAAKIMAGLVTDYSTDLEEDTDSIMKYGVYNMSDSVDPVEGTIFGDYYYMEALTRLIKDWALYW